MGSMSSRPTAPAAAAPTVVYYNVPSYTPPAAPVTDTTPDSAAAAESAKAEARSMGLLNRSRGVFSTVLTGFRGILSQPNDTGAQRKTLLGE